MDVEIVETSPLERQVQIAVEADKVEKESMNALQTLGRRVRVKGFRPGKVPKKELKRRYGQSVRRDVIQTLIRKTLSEALSREDLESVIYVSPPEVVDDNGSGGFSFRFHAEVRPELSPKGYLGLSLDTTQEAVKDEDIDREVERLRTQNAVIEPVTDRDEAGDADSLTVSYAPKDQNADLKFLEVTDHVLHMAEENPLDGLKEGLIGMAVGDQKDVTVTFPEDSPLTERIGGTEVVLNVTLHAIKQRVLPDVDDDFAEQVAEVETVVALREKIGDELGKLRERDFENQRRQELEEKLLGLVEFDLPTNFVTSRVEDEVRRQLQQFQQAGIDPEQLGLSMTAMKAEMTESVERRIKLEFVLKAISEREKVVASDLDVKEMIEKLARGAGQNAAELRRYYANPGNTQGLRERLALDKTLDFLLTKATISSEEPSATDLPVADPDEPSADAVGEVDDEGSDEE